MHVEEASWIKEELSGYSAEKLSPCLNIGSSTSHYRTVDQPHITKLITEPLESRGVKILHQDIKALPGVDIVGDIASPETLAELRMIGPKLILCNNLLEHIDKPEIFCRALEDILGPETILVITAPYKYPRHLDPIDNMFRPSVAELARAFPKMTVIRGSEVSVGPVYRSLVRNPKKLFTLLVRVLIPFYKWNGWLTAMNKCMYFFRERKISCVVLQNGQERHGNSAGISFEHEGQKIVAKVKSLFPK